MATAMSSQIQPDLVADKVLRRAELARIASRLQNRLRLAKFKTTHGLEEQTLDALEQEERRRRMLAAAAEQDALLSDDSSSASDQLPYYSSRALMSSPLKGPGAPIFSDAVISSNGSSAGRHRKRTYNMAAFEPHPAHHYDAMSSPSKRFRSSPPPAAQRAFGHLAPPSFTATTMAEQHGDPSIYHHPHHQFTQSSPIKPRRHQHFTTSDGPDVALFKGSHRISDALATSPSTVNYAAPHSDDDDDLLPANSFARPAAKKAAASRSTSPPRTPPMRSRTLGKKPPAAGNKDGAVPAGGKAGEEGAADLLMFLAQSPSPAKPQSRMEPPSTPPPKNGSFGGGGGGALALPSSMMQTPGGGSIFPATPVQTFDFADFVNITPSPAPPQKGWKTPGRTPLSGSRRRLTFDDF